MAELLPTVRVAIFDEAHQLNETGVQFLGRQLGTAQLIDFTRDGNHRHLVRQSEQGDCIGDGTPCFARILPGYDDLSRRHLFGLAGDNQQWTPGPQDDARRIGNPV